MDDKLEIITEKDLNEDNLSEEFVGGKMNAPKEEKKDE